MYILLVMQILSKHNQWTISLANLAEVNHSSLLPQLLVSDGVRDGGRGLFTPSPRIGRARLPFSLNRQAIPAFVARMMYRASKTSCCKLHVGDIHQTNMNDKPKAKRW